jgi:hypothetical protein
MIILSFFALIKFENINQKELSAHYSKNNLLIHKSKFLYYKEGIRFHFLFLLSRGKGTLPHTILFSLSALQFGFL